MTQHSVVSIIAGTIGVAVLSGCAGSPSAGTVQNSFRTAGASQTDYNSFDARRTYLRQANAVLEKATAGKYDLPVRLVDAVPPGMSREAIEAGLSGDVQMVIEFGEDGRVAITTVQSSPDPRLTSLAENAVRQWRIVPATRAGQPARVEVRQTFGFRSNFSVAR